MKGESRLEIANALNISEDAVKKHISRALGDLQRFVDEHQLN
jgi:DNA-directed RNA polymerase specialized sigma24 family protein